MLYAVSTAEVENGPDPVTLAVIASEVAWDAVLGVDSRGPLSF